MTGALGASVNSAKASDTKSAVQHQRSTDAEVAAPRPFALGQRLGNQGLGHLLRSRQLQAKLTVSHPTDVYEQEADRVADQVMRMADPQQQSFTNAAVSVQRKCQSCEEELHRSPESPAVPIVDAATEQSISSLSGRGSPLPQSVRAFMEPRFGEDFGGVRVHNDAHAHELARAVNAQAFTVGRNVVFGAGHYAPESDSGKRLLAHELTHVVQQTTSGKALAAGTVQRDAALSGADEERVQDIYEGAWFFITELGTAQAAHQSRRRAAWITLLEGVLKRIPDIEQHPEKINGVSVELRTYMNYIMAEVEKSDAEWRALERRYQDEHEWLLKQGSDDSTLAAKQLQEWYTEAKLPLDRGAIEYITDEDFATLEDGLTRSRHVSIGALKASRERVKRLEELLDVVAELRSEGEDEEKYVPRWNVHVQTEVDNLQLLIEAPHASHIYDYRAEFARMRSALVAKRDATLKTQKHELPFEAKVLYVSIGVADGLVGGLIETAKRVFDLAQIGVHFATFGYYEPEFVSGTAEAAAQGMSSRELVIAEIKGQTIDRLLAPVRLLEAIDKDDWQVVGREAVGVWDLARAIKHSRKHIKRVPELLAKVRRAERILRARLIGLIIEQPRLLPLAQLPLTPLALPDAPSGPIAATRPLPEAQLGDSPPPRMPEDGTTTSKASKPHDGGEPSVAVNDAYMADVRRVIGGSWFGRSLARLRGRIPDAVFDYAVDYARRAATASLNKNRFRRRSALPDHLNVCAMEGACGLGSQQVALALVSAGVSERFIYVNQAANISGLGEMRHRFVVCVMPGGVAMLVDTTFAQFIGKYDPAILNNPAAAKLSRELLGKGYAVLTDEVANLYLRMVSGGGMVPRTVPRVRVADFTRDSANLAKDWTLIKEPVP